MTDLLLRRTRRADPVPKDWTTTMSSAPMGWSSAASSRPPRRLRERPGCGRCPTPSVRPTDTSRRVRRHAGIHEKLGERVKVAAPIPHRLNSTLLGEKAWIGS
jgi:hypothetical protein